MLTTTSELIPTANVYSRNRILYKSTHAGNRDMFAVPGSPGVGSGEFPIHFLLRNNQGSAPGSPEAGSGQFLIIFY